MSVLRNFQLIDPQVPKNSIIVGIRETSFERTACFSLPQNVLHTNYIRFPRPLNSRIIFTRSGFKINSAWGYRSSKWTFTRPAFVEFFAQKKMPRKSWTARSTIFVLTVLEYNSINLIYNICRIFINWKVRRRRGRLSRWKVFARHKMQMGINSLLVQHHSIGRSTAKQRKRNSAA